MDNLCLSQIISYLIHWSIRHYSPDDSVGLVIALVINFPFVEVDFLFNRAVDSLKTSFHLLL